MENILAPETVYAAAQWGADLTQKQIVEAVTNDPALTETKVTLGDKEYPVRYLPYKDQLVFLSGVMPLFEFLGSKLASSYGIATPQAQPITGALLLKFCGEELPQLAQIALRQSDPSITVEDVTNNATSVFQIAKIVLAQIEKNQFITEITSFFASILPLMKAAMPKAKPMLVKK